MRWRNSDQSYGLVAQCLHWLVAALVLVQFVLAIKASDLPMSMERLILLGHHKSIGMTIWMLMLARLAWRFYTPPPPLPGTMPRWERRAARASHLSFYAILLTMPLLGWTASSAANLSVSWFGLFTWPDLVAPDQDLAKTLKTAHRFLGLILALLLTLHIGAALRHHFVKKDGVLVRMLPFSIKRRG